MGVSGVEGPVLQCSQFDRPELEGLLGARTIATILHMTPEERHLYPMTTILQNEIFDWLL
jgi:hypothetical protein